MIAAHALDIAPTFARPAPWWSNLSAVAARELRDAIRARWFLLYTLAFAGLGRGISYISAAGSGAAGLSGYGRTTAGLINLVLLVVPLMALTAGAGTIASDRERGMLSYLLAQSVSRWEVLLGKFLGLALALLACICLGLGVCAGVLAWTHAGTGADARSLLWLAGLAFGLALGMLSVGMLVSVFARKGSVATGTAVFLWLVLVFVSDLGVMAGALTLRMRIESLFVVCLANPLQVFKMWSLHAIDASLDVLGSVGLYAADTYPSGLPWMFAGSLALWVIVPLAVAGLVFSRRSAV